MSTNRQLDIAFHNSIVKSNQPEIFIT